MSVQSGTDLIAPISAKASTSIIDAADRILYTNTISPSSFPGTRLAQISQLWERYRFNSFRLRWVPAVPTSLACQFVIYEDTDPTDDPSIITDPDALIRQAVSQAKSTQFNFSSQNVSSLCQRKDDEMYYTGDNGNARFLYQGRFFVVQTSDLLDFNGNLITNDLTSGNLFLDWTCTFQTEQINPTAVVRQLDPIAPSIASTELTLDWTQPDATAIDVATVVADGPYYLANTAAQYNPTNTSNTSTIISDNIAQWRMSTSPLQFIHEGQPSLRNPGTETLAFSGNAGEVSNFTIVAYHYDNVNVSITPSAALEDEDLELEQISALIADLRIQMKEIKSFFYADETASEQAVPTIPAPILSPDA